MAIVLLAAGRGTRMKDLVSDRPKAMVTVCGDQSILDLNIRGILAEGSDKHTIVVSGYRRDVIDRYVGEQRARGIDVETVHNSEYSNRGPLMSIKIALDVVSLNEPVVIGNGDTYFNSQMFRSVCREPRSSKLLVSRVSTPDIDDMLVELDTQGNVRRASKIGFDSSFVSSGLLVVQQDDYRIFKRCIEDLLSHETTSNIQISWHSVLKEVVERGVVVTAECVPRSAWYEFDSSECIARFNNIRNGAVAIHG